MRKLKFCNTMISLLFIFSMFGCQASLAAPVIVGGSEGAQFNAPLILKDGTTPANPSSGFHKLYFNSITGRLTQLDSSGTTSEVGFSNPMTTNGDMIYQSSGVPTALAIGSADKVLTSTGSAPAWAKILNANIDTAAAITYGKLSLTGSIINTDIGPGAAIDYGKLDLTGNIVNSDINASAAIVDTKLATIATTGKVSNSATSATSSNTISTIVARDGSGNFSAGTISAALSGNASTSTALASNPTDCGSDTYATTIDASGNLTCASITNASTTGTSSNTISTLVLRDGSGNFSAGTITAALTGNASTATTASTATALVSNPTDCASNTYATTIDASGNLTCASITNASTTGTSSSTGSTLVLRDVSGNFSAGTIAAALTGNASTASALAANPSDCSANQYATTIAANGNLTCAQPSFADLTSFATIAQGGTNNSSLAVTAGGVPYTDGSKLVNAGAGSSGQVFTSNGSSAPTWKAATGGLISSREFSTNTTVDVDASGYSAYADAAGTRPVDGTGGSPNTTCAFSSSSPLTGTGSLLITKAGSANRQGEGCSYDFTADIATGNGTMALEFDYNVTSGTFTAGTVGTSPTDSDIEVFIYDKTNGALVSLSDYKLYVSSVTPTHFKQIFKGSASISYRAIFHIATTTTNNFTFQMDNISEHVDSGQLTISPISDWVPYTPTFVGLGTTTNVAFQSRRVGSDLEIQGFLTAGTTTATPGTFTIGYGGTSANVLIDGTKLPNGTTKSNVVGYGGVDFASAASYLAVVQANATTAITLGGQTSTISAINVPNASGLISSGQSFSIHAKVPIIGWTSSQSAIRADTTPGYWAGYHDNNCLWSTTSTTLADPSNGGDSTCTFTELKNTNFGTVSSYLISSNKGPGIIFTPTQAGSYFVCVGVNSLSNSVAGGTSSLRLVDGSANELGGTAMSMASNGGDASNVCGILNVPNAGVSTTVKLLIATNGASTATINLVGSGLTGSRALQWSIFAIGQNLPVPLLVGSVTSNTSGLERIERATITGSATTPTIASQSGAWLSPTITRASAGAYNYTINTGMFSSAPSCTCRCVDVAHSDMCQTTATTTTTALNTNCSSSSSGFDTNVEIICMGPR